MVDTYQQDLSKVVVLGGGNTGWTTALYIKDRSVSYTHLRAHET